ncbi:MAG TPA: L-seryl-tRNA(Sec) selenium transferase, partial [Gammaproteobacteria bacterium]|nr:L-seryl-tRNA(Sec) selenium transferase [Gammaproteobacteria bacterium]
MSRELLRRLPAVNAWLSSESGAALCAEYSRAEVVEVMRSRLAEIRRRLANGGGELPDFSSDAYTSLLRADLLARRASSLKPVINATGIVIHTNLGRAPLAPEAIEAMVWVAGGYSNLEYGLDDGKRGSRSEHVSRLLCRLTGAEAALVVNNCAAAVLLALRVLAASGEVVVSRGELIEIGGSFRMPDVIAQSGASMVEVGTTNRTTVRDYAEAVTEQTRVLLTSHPSNYRIVGFTASPEPGELAALAKERGLVLVRDLGSGSLCRLAELGAAEPTVGECVAGGADLVTFSGDKLLGGPQAGVIVGRAELIDRLQRHPLARAFRIDKLSLAALIATLKLYEPPNDPRERVPVLRMISQSRASVGRRARRLALELGRLEGVTATLLDGASYAGGGALPLSELPT